jgi:hypothetical protein
VQPDIAIPIGRILDDSIDAYCYRSACLVNSIEHGAHQIGRGQDTPTRCGDPKQGAGDLY